MLRQSLSNLASTLRNPFRRNRRQENETTDQSTINVESQPLLQARQTVSQEALYVNQNRLTRTRSEDLYLNNENFYHEIPLNREQNEQNFQGGAARFSPGVPRFRTSTPVGFVETQIPFTTFVRSTQQQYQRIQSRRPRSCSVPRDLNLSVTPRSADYRESYENIPRLESGGE